MIMDDIYDNANSAVEATEMAKRYNDDRPGIEIMNDLLLKSRMLGSDSIYINDEFKEEVRNKLLKEIREGISYVDDELPPPIYHSKVITPKVTMEITDLTSIATDTDETDDFITPILYEKPPDPYVIISVGGCHILIPKSRFKKYPRVKQIVKFYKYLTKQGNFYALYHIYRKPYFNPISMEDDTND